MDDYPAVATELPAIPASRTPWGVVDMLKAVAIVIALTVRGWISCRPSQSPPA